MATDSKLKLLQTALRVFREKGYTATTVDDLCRSAGVSKGSFFHHFESKEALALATINYWNDMTGALFEQAAYQCVEDPRDKLMAYLELRAELVAGPVPEFTCLLGTLVQETFGIHPAIRQACDAGITAHARTLVPMIEQAKALYAPQADWSPLSLAYYTQASIQGAFVLAKAQDDASIAVDCIRHLSQYVMHLLDPLVTRSP